MITATKFANEPVISLGSKFAGLDNALLKLLPNNALLVVHGALGIYLVD
jgi:hypothetical protein